MKSGLLSPGCTCLRNHATPHADPMPRRWHEVVFKVVDALTTPTDARTMPQGEDVGRRRNLGMPILFVERCPVEGGKENWKTLVVEEWDGVEFGVAREGEREDIDIVVLPRLPTEAQTGRRQVTEDSTHLGQS